jgi:hypothetical protein
MIILRIFDVVYARKVTVEQYLYLRHVIVSTPFVDATLLAPQQRGNKANQPAPPR